MVYSIVYFKGKHKTQIDVDTLDNVDITDHNIMFVCRNPQKIDLFNTCVVYGISTEKYLKIGSSKNFVQRFNTLQCSNPERLCVEFLLPVPYNEHTVIEKSLHHRYKSYRINREWFDKSVLLDSYLQRKIKLYEEGLIF